MSTLIAISAIRAEQAALPWRASLCEHLSSSATFQLNQRVPDYINPDGTKGIIGDIVYYKDHEHQFGIEAKLGNIRLTKGEFNEWVVNTDTARWPHAFIGIGTLGIGLCSWAEFRASLYCSGDRKQ